MQPSLGLNLRKYLFEPLTGDTILTIETEIYQTIDFWLPFVNIDNLEVTMGEASDIGSNTINISVTFSIRNSRNYFDTIQVTIGE